MNSDTTLTRAPVAPLVERLYADAAVTRKAMMDRLGHMTPAERVARMGDPNADFRVWFGQARDVHMAVGPNTGRLLYMLARGNGARHIVEFGTSFAISTIHLAAAVRDNGGGKVIGSEFEPNKIEAARKNLEAAGLADLVEVREGDALETLARDLPETIDLVLLDGHKPFYARVLSLLAPRLRAGSWIVADNADACPDYVAMVRAPGSGYLSLPFDEDVELSLKV